MKQPTHKVKYTLALLLLAVLTATQILSAVYAKYTVSSGPFYDSARVALYEVKVEEGTGNDSMDNITNSGLTGEDVNLDAAGDKNISSDDILNNTASLTKTYKIVNESEVAVSYDVVVELSKKLPAGTTMSIKLNEETSVEINDADYEVCTCGNMSDSHFRYTFVNDKCTFAPNANESGAHTIQLTFTTVNTTEAPAVTDLSGIGVTVTVNAVQID